MKYVFMRFPGFKSKAVTLSYDDAAIYDQKLVEIMDKYGLKGTFNINSGLFSEDGRWHMTKKQALELYANSGHEVAIHGKKHLSLAELSPAMAVDEVINDRIALENMFDTIVTGMAYANGSYNDQVVEILKNCGVEYCRTTISTERFDIPTDWLRMPATCHHNNPRLMELARAFVEDTPPKYYWSRAPKLFYLWGHSFEFNNDGNWNVIEEFGEYVGNREDVWYATNIEIYKYVKAYESLQFSANGEKVYNPSAVDVYLNYYDKEICIPSGGTLKIK